MESLPLPELADTIRKEIEATISQATTVDEDDNGNKRYGGDSLRELIARMKVVLGIDETWEGRLRYWSKRTKLVNDRKDGYLIPLSDSVCLTPGGLLRVGRYIRVDNEPILDSGATALLIVPP